MRDLVTNIKAVLALAPVVVSDNTLQTGITIDRLGFDSVSFVVLTGTLADAGAEFAVSVEEGDASDLSDAAAAADADLIAADPSSATAPEAQASFIQSDDLTTKKIGYRGSKRYCRVKITITNNAAAAPLAAVAILGHPAQSPVA